MLSDLLLLGLLWAGWSVLHSTLIAPPVVDALKRRLGSGARYYRLVYNLFALLSLLSIVLWSQMLPYPAVLSWRGGWVLIAMGGWLLAAALFYAGAKAYPLLSFLGIAQLRSPEGAEGEPFLPLSCCGVLGLVRHPWYVAGMLLLWCRNMAPQDLLTSFVLTCYFIIGAALEEKKLRLRYGDMYHEYCKRVPMFVPQVKTLYALIKQR